MKKTLLFLAVVLMGMSMMAQSTYTMIASESELNEGDKVILVGFDNDNNAFVMSYQKTNNRHAVAIDVTGGTVTTTVATDPSSQTEPFELTVGGASGAWTFFDELNNGYLYASGGGNYLKTQTTLDDKGQWDLEIEEDGFKPVSNGGVEQNIMRYNVTSTLFGCYKSTSNVNGLIYIFKEGGAPVIYPEPSNYPTSFYPTVDADGVTLHWIDATGEQLPQKYLVLASEDGVTVPTDGVPVANSDFAKNVNYGVGTVTFDELESGETYHFAIFPYTNSGANIDYKTDGDYPSAVITMPTVNELFYEDFDEDLGAFTAYNSIGEQVWQQASYNNVTYANMNGYADGAHENMDWLISPNIVIAENVYLDFSTAMKFNGEPLHVLLTVDYQDGDDPEDADWENITDLFEYSTGNYTWVESGIVDITDIIESLEPSGNTFRVAFLYMSTDEAAAAWEIDYVRVVTVVYSVEENDAVSFNLYPNPASNSINIVADRDAEAQVVDMAGRQVMSVNVVEGVNTINVADLTSGVYFVRMNGAVVKFVKR